MNTINMMSNNVYFDADVSHCNTSIGCWYVYYTNGMRKDVLIEDISKSDAMRICNEENERIGYIREEDTYGDDPHYEYRHVNK